MEWHSTLFENYSKYRIWIFKAGLSGNTVWPLVSSFSKTRQNWPFFGILKELLSTQNVNVARFARNVKCDFFVIFTHCESGTLLTHWRLNFLDSEWYLWHPILKPSNHRYLLRDYLNKSPCLMEFQVSLSIPHRSKFL